ncbi:hypothetical protein [Thomasclavelia cocleata]|jgi:hypothetical protein|uniref:Uncharacterized protein n=1 Tax=Thomasclavelia cocleata TaxID=69824 RepID=A0A1I0HEI6_9FIRM|nr:hypothetical protein [Thomasclavelia cocleata]MCI9631562.1 hypothetical protein [Thomasclavelia cocleata]MCR1961286.1 hypothetical protein [Thomasclavelia cocleata]NDO42713.1 hypothetical protein [Thomasclavelia cocleata]PJN79686.1 hypothetical protein CWE04_13045 [Thomasclavelia cocleata]SET82239.1 hypothetical protein SAMN04489758_1491 [Thomasclavelia cocleata]
MVYDTFYNNIYFIANYQTEVDKALDEANTGKGQKYISPDTHIYLLENDKLKKIYSSNRKLIYRLLPEENGNLTFTESESIPAWDPEYFSYSFNSKENKKTPTINIDKITNVTQFAFFISSDEIVFLATQEDTDNKEHTHRGIYLYNAKSKNIELLFETDEEYINNFVVLNE